MSHESDNDYFGDDSGHEGHYFQCDAPGCTTAFEGVGSFQEVWEEAKRKDWRCVPKKMGLKVALWQHLCPQHRDTRL